MESKDETFDEGHNCSEDNLVYMEEQEEPLDFSMRRSPRESLADAVRPRSRSTVIPRFQPVPVHSTTGMPIHPAPTIPLHSTTGMPIPILSSGMPLNSMQVDGMNQYLENNRNYLEGSDYSEDTMASPQNLSGEMSEASGDSRQSAPPSGESANREPYFLNRFVNPNRIFNSETDDFSENSPCRQRNFSGESSSDGDDNPGVMLPYPDLQINLKAGYNCCFPVNGGRECGGQNYRTLSARHFGQRMQSHLQQRNRTLSEESPANEYGPPSETLDSLNLSSTSPPLTLDPPPVLGEEAMATVHRFMIQCMSRQGPVPPQFHNTLNLYEAIFASRARESQQSSESVSPPASSQHGPMIFPSGSQGPMNFPSTSQGVLNIPPTSQVPMSFPSTSQGLMSFPSSSQGAMNISSSSPGPIGFPSTSQGAMGFPLTSQGAMGFPSTSQGPMSIPSACSGMSMVAPDMQQPILSLLQTSSFFSGDGNLEKSPSYVQFRRQYLRRRNLSSKPRRGNRDRSSDGLESGDQDGHRRRDSDEGTGPENSGAEGSDRAGDAGSRDDENNNNGMRLDKNGNPRDAAYWERRRRNNQAAKRSRDAKRNRELENEIQLEFLKWLLLPNLYRLMGSGNNNNNNRQH